MSACGSGSDWKCTVGVSAGYFSAAMWFVVLVPQIWHNYKRRSTEGLSAAWAFANFTASTVNAFFVFRFQLPMYSKVMAVYMPVLELIIICQMAWYTPRMRLQHRVLAIIGCVLVICFIAAEIALPQYTSELQWIATVLWCVETFPQLLLNAQRSSGDGQSMISVAITVCGKTCDMLSAFLVDMPLQVHILCFYSSATAFADACQVIWYSWRRCWQERADKNHSVIIVSQPSPPNTDDVKLLLQDDIPTHTALPIRPAIYPFHFIYPVSIGCVAILTLLLLLLLFFATSIPVFCGLVSSETAAIALCLLIPLVLSGRWSECQRKSDVEAGKYAQYTSIPSANPSSVEAPAHSLRPGPVSLSIRQPQEAADVVG